MAEEPKKFAIDEQEIKIAVDIVVFSYDMRDLHTLMIQRTFPPDEGKWAFPGGFIRNDEELLEAVIRLLQDESGMRNPDFVTEIGTFGKVDRDPRRRVISVSYLILENELQAVSGQVQDYMATSDAKWIKFDDVPRDLAFDHEDIFDTAKEKLRGLVNTTDAAKWLMPEKFTLTELQMLFQKIMDEKLEKRNFRKMINKRGYLDELSEKMYGSHRPATLYKFKHHPLYQAS